VVNRSDRGAQMRRAEDGCNREVFVVAYGGILWRGWIGLVHRGWILPSPAGTKCTP
jgi:hypothetical protein